MKTYAYMNHGRWLVMCPKCGSEFKVNREDRTMICFVCHPNVMANANERFETMSPITHTRQVIWRPVPDLALREAEIIAVMKDKEEYEIVFPSEAEAIEKAVSGKEGAWQNWYPDRKEIRAKYPKASAYGQTVAQLKAEGVNHGL